MLDVVDSDFTSIDIVAIMNGSTATDYSPSVQPFHGSAIIARTLALPVHKLRNQFLDLLALDLLPRRHLLRDNTDSWRVG